MSAEDVIAHHVGDWPEVESERAYVVYEADSGVVVHLHQETTFRGAQGFDVERDEGQAIELARRFGVTGDLKVLAVEVEEIDSPVPVAERRVDLDQLKLVTTRG